LEPPLDLWKLAIFAIRLAAMTLAKDKKLSGMGKA
jgi:hypothetical protein